MKRKISLSMCCIAAISVIVTAVLISFVLYNRNYNKLKNNIENEAEYMAEAMNFNGVEYLDSVKDVSSSRITWIDRNGNVLFDNCGKELDNHSDRPEFREAIESGYGSGSRVSNTLKENTYYYAILLDDGTVLRVSETTSSLYSDIFRSLPYLIFMICVIIVAAFIVSHFQTKRIVKPINEMDLNNPSGNFEYEELTPLLERIEKQNKDINDYIQELKHKKNEFNTVTENMSEGLIIIKDHTVLSCNKSAMTILGCSGDVLGKNILELNHSGIFINAVEGALNGKASESNMIIENKNFMLMANPVIEKNNISGAVLLLIDVTEKISREAMRREFSANVSHELKTPLTTISGYAEIMKDGWADPKDYKKFAEKIYNEGKRLINLIEDIINLSRLDENDSSMEKEPVDLLMITKDVNSRLAKKAEDKKVDFESGGEHAVIQGIPQILDEMIYNLCDNAIKYNRENGYVKATVINNNNNVKFIVADNGIGIPAEDLDRVFERFYCVDKSHSRETGGTGLGLSIVKHGAMFHNAKIDVDSVLGEGTTITLTFNK
ncbi:ATP-binding protein [Porcipelethomonas sp.]|uniref:ATP-binding protein n=1 Tax=Porcipelethomonas sp. TaxID=2981675 RepID=UPI003EF240FF